MRNFTLYSVESSPTGSKEAMEAVAKKFGFVPNLIRELAGAPAAVKAYVMLSGLLDETSLTPVERQIILVTTSAENGCE